MKDLGGEDYGDHSNQSREELIQRNYTHSKGKGEIGRTTSARSQNVQKGYSNVTRK